jgi:glycerophosphoryl diester phosphodiesterase
MGASLPSASTSANRMRPLIIAHRGDSAHRPENTKAAFVRAVEVGAEMVELDVQLTRDGHVVIIHDDTVDRTTNGEGKVGDLTLAQIRSLSAGYPDRFGSAFASERIPQLVEALELLRGRARALIEIKTESVSSDHEGGIEARTVAEIQRLGMTQEVALISFDRRALLRARECAPEIARGHLFLQAAPAQVVEGAREVDCSVVMPEKGMLSEELCELAREAGLKVATWVVDDVGELRSLVRLGLYGVGTNLPGLLLEALADET